MRRVLSAIGRRLRELPGALVAELRRDPWLTLGMALACVAVAWPMWNARFLPYMDLPQHLATVRILHSLHDPAFGLAPFYRMDLASTQYLAWYLAADLLADVVSVETAARLLMSAYAVGLPLSLAAYMRAFGRDPAVGLLAAPLVHNVFLFMGFVNYVCAIPLAFWGLALLRRLMDDLRPGRYALLVAVTVLLFYTHAMAYLAYGLAAGLIGLLGGRGFHPRHWWRQALHLVPSLALMGYWILRSRILAGEEAWEGAHGGRTASPVRLRWEPIVERLGQIPRQLLDVYPGQGDDLVLLLLAGLAALLLLFRRGTPEPEEVERHGRARAWLRERTPEAIALAMAVTYVLSPIAYKWVWPVSHRLVPVVALFALGTLAWRRLPARPVLLVAPAAALALYAGSLHADRAEAFSEEANHPRELLKQARPGHRLMALIFDRGSRVLNEPAYLHFGQYYVLDRGGVATFSFVDFPQSPVRYSSATGPPRLPDRFEWTPGRFRFPEHGRYYDYFLVRDGGAASPAQPFGRHRDRVEKVARRDAWVLYRRREAFDGGEHTGPDGEGRAGSPSPDRRDGARGGAQPSEGR